MARYTVAAGRAVRHGEGDGEDAKFSNYLAGQEISLDEDEAAPLLEGGHVVTARQARQAARLAVAAVEEDDGEEEEAAPPVLQPSSELQMTAGTDLGGAPEAEEPPKRGPGRPRRE